MTGNVQPLEGSFISHSAIIQRVPVQMAAILSLVLGLHSCFWPVDHMGRKRNARLKKNESEFSGVLRGGPVGHAPPWANIFFSIHLIALQWVKKLVRLFARATEMNDDGINCTLRVVGNRTAQFAYVPAANAHKYYRRAVFSHLHGPTMWAFTRWFGYC